MKKRGAPLKAPATPEAAALQARRQAAKRMNDKARLDSLRVQKVLDKVRLARHEPGDVPQKTLKELFGGDVRIRMAKIIVGIAMKEKDPDLRFAAAKYALSWTDGLVARQVEIGGRDGGPIQVSDERPSLAQLLGGVVREALGHDPPERSGKDDPPKTINGEVSEDDKEEE